MYKRWMAMVAVLVLGVATVLWVSANPQEKASVKPAVMKSDGSCCPVKGAGAASVQPASAVKPAVAKEGQGKCPYLEGKAQKAVSRCPQQCADCPEMKATLAANGTKGNTPKTNAKPVAAKDGCKDCLCPSTQSGSKATEAKAKPVSRG